MASMTTVEVSEIDPNSCEPWATGTRELDYVLNGGLQRGSTTLLYGEPGVGTSTLMLQVAIDLAVAEIVDRATSAKQDPLVVLYVLSEERPADVIAHVKRLAPESKGVPPANLHFESMCDVMTVKKRIAEIKADILIVDSIRKMVHPEVEAKAGTPRQQFECIAFVSELSRSCDLASVIVMHLHP